MKKLKILVLDDEKVIVDVFSRLMKQFNYDADFFVDTDAAIKAIAKNPAAYSMLVCDIKMPKTDGISFAGQVRILCPQLPIIFMTGFPTDAVREKIGKMEKTTLLEKPFPIRETFQELIPKLLK